MQVLRHPNATVGTINFPYPCNAPFIVWSNIVNIIVKELICNIASPALAFGNNKLKIGPANINIPTVHGNPINIDINNEKDVLFKEKYQSSYLFYRIKKGEDLSSIAKKFNVNEDIIKNMNIMKFNIK